MIQSIVIWNSSRFHLNFVKSMISTNLLLFNRTSLKKNCIFNSNWSTKRLTMKQWITFESTKIVTRTSFTFISKRNHVFDFRWSFLFKQIKIIFSSNDRNDNSNESLSRTIKIQNLNVFLLDFVVNCRLTNEICSLLTVDLISCFRTFKIHDNNFFFFFLRFTSCFCSQNFDFFFFFFFIFFFIFF